MNIAASPGKIRWLGSIELADNHYLWKEGKWDFGFVLEVFWLNVLSLTGQEPSLKSMLCKIGNEMVLLHDLLNKMETEVQQQEKLKNLLKVIFFPVHKILKDSKESLISA